jgi:ferrous iron transport protein B
MCSRGWSYIVKAATIILLCNTAVQIMQTFDWSFTVTESANTSILASVSGPISYILVPIVGVLSWQLTAAAITGFIAKENVVGTLAVCFPLLAKSVTEDGGISGVINGNDVMGITSIAALAYLMFNLFIPPCFAAIGAMNSEMKSAKWLWGGIGLQFAIGYSVSYLIYTVGTAIVSPNLLNVTGAIIGGIAILIIAAIITYLILRFIP